MPFAVYDCILLSLDTVLVYGRTSSLVVLVVQHEYGVVPYLLLIAVMKKSPFAESMLLNNIDLVMVTRASLPV